MVQTEQTHRLAENFINAAYNDSHEEFLDQMRKIHPTLQQILAGRVLLWLQDYITYPTDSRNRFSVEYWKKLFEDYNAVNPDEPLRKGFPLV